MNKLKITKIIIKIKALIMRAFIFCGKISPNSLQYQKRLYICGEVNPHIHTMFLVFDTETNGRPKNYAAPMSEVDNWPRVTQLAWALFGTDGTLVRKRSDVIFPDGWTVPHDQFFIDNNISTERCIKEGIPIVEALDAFVVELNGAVSLLVAHNMAFDYNVLGAECIRAKKRADRKPFQLCTMEASTSVLKLPGGRNGQYKWPKLKELHQYLFKCDFEGAHDAMFDVMATAKCLFGLYSKNLLLTQPSLWSTTPALPLPLR